MKSYYLVTLGNTRAVVNNITAGKAKSIMRMYGIHTYHMTTEPGLYPKITFTKQGMYIGAYLTKSHRLIHWGVK